MSTDTSSLVFNEPNITAQDFCASFRIRVKGISLKIAIARVMVIYYNEYP